jgi:hypothetical protein
MGEQAAAKASGLSDKASVAAGQAWDATKSTAAEVSAKAEQLGDQAAAKASEVAGKAGDALNQGVASVKSAVAKNDADKTNT